MHRSLANALANPAILVALVVVTNAAAQQASTPVQLGPRPFFLVDDMKEGPLKDKLKQCQAGPFVKTDFSIAHRGAPLMFPEHTRKSYLAGARMGAGILECDVTFTKDLQLVCRHAQCDLHTSTDILSRPELAAKCTKPFTAADRASGRKADAQCCTSDLTLAEFKSLRGKMDAFDPQATSAEAYMNATAKWRTDLYAARGTLMSHAESIALLKELGVKFTPELKAPSVAMPFGEGFTQDLFAQKMIDEYKSAGIEPQTVFPQSFQLRDILYWLKTEPSFGAQAIFLDNRDETLPGFDAMKPDTWKPTMAELKTQGVRTIAPPTHVLVALDADRRIVPSAYAKAAKEAGLDIVTWTLERSGPMTDGGGYYFSSVKDVITRGGDTYEVLDALAQQVGVRGVFSDWPATVTYYASCMKLY